MADSVRVCVFLCFLYNFGCALGSKEFFCQDPDTEELHHVNTTWASTKFCGNYTCKLKKRVTSDMDTQASLQNYVIASNAYENHKSPFSEEHQKAELSITTKRELPETTTKSKNNFENDLTSFTTPKRDTDNNKDRYLNDDEIKSISNLLHTIKKSDIDAIVEVYNLAQDIYKEMETTTVKNEVKFNELKFVESKVPGSKVSYWYDPLYHTDFTFDRVKEITHREQMDPVPSVVASNFYPVYSTPYTEKIAIPYTVQRKSLPKIPYYYNLPVQSVPAVQKKYIPVTVPVQDILRSYNGNYNQPCPWSNKILKKQYSFYPYSQRMESVAKLLPLPFSYFNNFENYFPTLYRQNYTASRQNPRTAYARMEELKTPLSKPNTQMAGLPNKTYSQSVTQKSNLDILNNLENDISRFNNIRDSKDVKKPTDKLSKPLKENQNKLPPWQTLPLSQKVLDEVKANILENTDKLLKPFTLKKKLRLERVAKVLKLDDIENRKKREIVEVTRGDVLEENDFEVFLEKITCEIGTDPGLFSLGDMSLPFPACCPRRLDREEDLTRRKPGALTTPDISRQPSNTAVPMSSSETNTLSVLNSEFKENSRVDIPLTANSLDVSRSSSIETTLPVSNPSVSTETLKLTTNVLGIPTLLSTLEVPESTVKTSSSPQASTSDSSSIINTTSTPSDDDLLSELSELSELSILPSKSTKVDSLRSNTEPSTASSNLPSSIPTVLSSVPTTLRSSSTSSTASDLSTNKASKLNKFSHLKY